MLNNILLVSLTMSAVIVLLLIISPLLLKRYSAKWCYFVWLILALRLVIPWRLDFLRHLSIYSRRPTKPLFLSKMECQA